MTRHLRNWIARPRRESGNAATSDDLGFRIAKLDLRPNDVLVVKVNVPISDEIRGGIESAIRSGIEAKTKILVIDSAIDLAVLTKSEIESRIAPASEEDAA